MDHFQMLSKSLFQGETIEFVAVDSERDAELISGWTINPEFSRRFFMETINRQHPVFEIKKKLKEKLKKADETHNDYYFLVKAVSDAAPVGIVQVGWILPSMQVSRAFLYFGSEQQLFSFGRETLQMILRYAFMELSLHRVDYEVPGYCQKEIRIVEEAGFTKEFQRKDYAFADGRYYDSLVYSMLKPEWKNLNNWEN